MNRAARALLNVMRIEVLLGIGLVLWVFSLETKALDLTCFYDVKGQEKVQELKNLQPEKGYVEVTKNCQVGRPCFYYYAEVWSENEVSIAEDLRDGRVKVHHLIDRRTLHYELSRIVDDEYMVEYTGYCKKGLIENQI